MIKGLYIGLMSGTSMDGIDAALVEIDANTLALRSFLGAPYTPQLRTALETLVRTEQASLAEIGRLHVEVGGAFAAATLDLLETAGFRSEEIVAIGSHGQTVLHRPDARPGYSIQLGDASVIAYRTGITTVADFRAKDLAAGGQGAPLVPAFHQFAFTRKHGTAHGVLNLGGIANLTLFSEKAHVSGFDSGPGNTLLDTWVSRCRSLDYDPDGAWGRSGVIHFELLREMLRDEYFTRAGPKSSGRDYFNLDWILAQLKRVVGSVADADVQATLTELTAATVAAALLRELPECRQLAVCGGGSRNSFLLERLSGHLPAVQICSTEEFGIPPAAVEACAFAWMAARRIANLPANIPDVTGAPQALVLGAVHHPR